MGLETSQEVGLTEKVAFAGNFAERGKALM